MDQYTIQLGSWKFTAQRSAQSAKPRAAMPTNDVFPLAGAIAQKQAMFFEINLPRCLPASQEVIRMRETNLL